MNFYKKIVPGKAFRLKILHMLSPLPDKLMIRLQYFMKTGRLANLKKPKRYTEKVQWYKLNYMNPMVTVCSDKYDVREYVKEKGFDSILNKTFGVWNSAEKIDFSELPSSFMLKATHGSGTNLLVDNKERIDIDRVRNLAREWLNYDSACIGREWGYKNIEPKIIAESVLPRDHRGDLPDYKFFCFNGKVFCLYVMRDYTDNHENGELAFFDRDFHPLNVYRRDFKPLFKSIEKPVNYDYMISIAESLSQGFPHVRVDLYNINGDIYFGEMTFYNASGYTEFSPDEFDFELGEKFDINSF